MNNSAKRKYYYNYFIVSVLILFNIYLLYKNNDLREVINSHTIDLHEELTSYHDIRVNRNMITDMNKGLKMMTFIWEISCSSCIDNEISLLNEYYNMFNGGLKVVFIAGTVSSELYGAKFPYITVRNIGEILNKEVHPQNPITILFDENFIYELREVRVDKPHSDMLSRLYYQNKLNLFNGLNSTK